VTTVSPSLAMVVGYCCKRLHGGAGDVQGRTDFVVAECHSGFGVNQCCVNGIQTKFSHGLVLNDASDGGECLREHRKVIN